MKNSYPLPCLPKYLSILFFFHEYPYLSVRYVAGFFVCLFLFSCLKIVQFHSVFRLHSFISSLEIRDSLKFP